MGYRTYESTLLQFQQSNFTMADLSVSYFAINALGSNANLARIYPPRAGTIRAATVFWYNTVNCTTEDTLIEAVVNDTTTATIYNGTFVNGTAPVTATNLNLPVSLGDFVHLRITAPTWVTNPTGIYLQAVFEIQH